MQHSFVIKIEISERTIRKLAKKICQHADDIVLKITSFIDMQDFRNIIHLLLILRFIKSLTRDGGKKPLVSCKPLENIC